MKLTGFLRIGSPTAPALPPAAIQSISWTGSSVPVVVLGRHLKILASLVSCGLQGHLGFIFRTPHGDFWGSLYRDSDSQMAPGLSCSVWPPCLASFIPSKLSPYGEQCQVLLPPQLGASGFALRPPLFYCASASFPPVTLIFLSITAVLSIVVFQGSINLAHYTLLF